MRTLTQQEKDLFKEDLGGGTFNGDQISYLLNGVEVCRTELPNFSNEQVRFKLAKLVGVKEFDNIILYNPKGDKRADGNDIMGLSVTSDHYDIPYGKYCGMKYKEYLNTLEEWVKPQPALFYFNTEPCHTYGPYITLEKLVKFRDIDLTKYNVYLKHHTNGQDLLLYKGLLVDTKTVRHFYTSHKQTGAG